MTLSPSRRPRRVVPRHRRKFGLDIGVTAQTVIVWAVLTPAADLRPGSLNRNYGGVSAGGAAVGLGVAPTR